MAGKGCLGRDSDHAVSKTSKVRPVRVVHISNPTMVKASVSEFRSVVQSLTGQKRSQASATTTAQSSPTSSYALDVLGAYSDRSPALKAAKLEDAEGLECSWIRTNSAALDILNVCNNNNNNSGGTELGDRSDGEHKRPEKHEVSPIEIHDILSQQTFESPDDVGDNKFFGLEFLSPSLISSDLDNLYLNLLM